MSARGFIHAEWSKQAKESKDILDCCNPPRVSCSGHIVCMKQCDLKWFVHALFQQTIAECLVWTRYTLAMGKAKRNEINYLPCRVHNLAWECVNQCFPTMWSVSKGQGNCLDGIMGFLMELTLKKTPEWVTSKSLWWLGYPYPSALPLCTPCLGVKLQVKKIYKLLTFVLGSYHTASSFHAFAYLVLFSGMCLQLTPLR